MELEGKIIDFEERSGVSKSTGNEWNMLGVVIEGGTIDYPKQIYVEFWSDKAEVAKKMMNTGDTISVKLNPESRKSPQGYWNTSLRCWGFEVIERATEDDKIKISAQQEATKSIDSEENNDLPF